MKIEGEEVGIIFILLKLKKGLKPFVLSLMKIADMFELKDIGDQKNFKKE